MNKVLGLITVIAVVGTIALYATAPQLANKITSSIDNEFNSWKVQYGKYYASEVEQAYRKGIWIAQNQKVQIHNADFTQTYKMGINQFSDLTTEEFKAIYLSLKPTQSSMNVASDQEITTGLPQNVNWVTAGAVTPIKNQGNCGSCWAFSTTGGLEGVSFVFGKNLQSFSEQQLVDCSSAYGNQGCNGGLMDYAFNYVKANGIVTEAQYPYTSGNTGVAGKCKINSGPFKISGYTNVPVGNCNALITACNTQPVSVGVDAQTWSSYSSGIFSNCGTQLDHGVLLVGYVTGSYLLVKNSWGTSWGENGYIQLKWGNTCGICNTASVPNAAK